MQLVKAIGRQLFGFVLSFPCYVSGLSKLLSKTSWGGAMVLGKLPMPGRLTIWITVAQGPIALAVCAGGGCLDIFTLIYPLSPLSPSLWETARYRLKYCLKGPLNPKQPTNQPNPRLRFITRCKMSLNISKRTKREESGKCFEDL